MIEPVAVGIHALGRLGDIKGMNSVILGAGPIGNLAAQSAKGLRARTVMITDMRDYRLGVARDCGIDYVVNNSKEELDGAIDRYFGGNGADAFVECVGAQATIGQAIKASERGPI